METAPSYEYEAPHDEPAQGLVDSPDIRQEVIGVFNRIASFIKEREAVNKDIQAEYDRLEAKGINRKAAKAAFKRFNMTAEEREAHDFSFAICAKAIGAGYQPELFQEHQTQAH